MTRRTLAEPVDHVVSILGLQSIAGRRTARFSQGERMKTALARAILHAPGNLPLDEPANGLDVPTVRSLRDLLRRWRDSGVCIEFSSHVLEEVRPLFTAVFAGFLVWYWGRKKSALAYVLNPRREMVR